jgi:hypothetical protein
MNSLMILAGHRARAHLQTRGLQADDIVALPGAAGGPKGLILNGLDKFRFGQWLTPGPCPRQFIGASIGAWRMAAACTADPLAAINRLAQQYTEAQCYRKGATADEISAVCDGMIQTILADQAPAIVSNSHRHLLAWVNRGRAPLHARGGRAKKRGFAAAVLANTASRGKLGRYLERVVYAHPNAALDWLTSPFDTLPSEYRALDEHNLKPALLASGSIPFILNPVHEIPGSPPGPYWDGGLTDYHLALPYDRLNGLVLYPHFSPSITPGWLDKWVKSRRAPTQWLTNMILICPSPEFVASLPAGKIPDRSDFAGYQFDHEVRMRHWRAAMAESQRLADEWASFVDKPDMNRVMPLGDARR